MRGLRGKRGVSPLIATVVLIAFAVALGVVIMNLGKTLVTTPHPSSAPLLGDRSCARTVAIGLHATGGQEVLLTGSGASSSLEFVLDNKGTVAIKGLIITVDGSKSKAGTYQAELQLNIEQGKVSKQVISYNEELYGPVQAISFRPYYQGESGIVSCADADYSTSDVKRE